MSKDNIRRKLLELREKQPLKIKEEKDKKILKRILSMEIFQEADEFFTYLSHRGEVGTDALIEQFFGKKRIIVPKITKGEICLYELHNPTEFTNGKFGVREPRICLKKDELSAIKIAFIPGIAFDLNGGRIGFGGGYFDRLLKKLHCTTIGLAYEFQIIEKVPVHPYDVAVDYVITEKREIKCQNHRSNVKSTLRETFDL